jgi:hypothetical protein
MGMMARRAPKQAAGVQFRESEKWKESGVGAPDSFQPAGPLMIFLRLFLDFEFGIPNPANPGLYLFEGFR